MFGMTQVTVFRVNQMTGQIHCASVSSVAIRFFCYSRNISQVTPKSVFLLSKIICTATDYPENVILDFGEKSLVVSASLAVLLFSRLNKTFCGYFDLGKIILDNENEFFLV